MGRLGKERIVQRWAEWELLHFGGVLYELRQVSRTGWILRAAVYAADDADALVQTRILMAAANQESV